jgi:hypothetical protein
MRPRKRHLGVSFKIPSSDELSARLEDQEFDLLPYDVRSRAYLLRLTDEDFATRQSTLTDLIRQAAGTTAPDTGLAEPVSGIVR